MVDQKEVSWEELKEKKELLLKAMELKKDKNNRVVVAEPEICGNILADYKEVNKSVYMELIHLIYSNKEIATTTLSYQNEKYSFLHASLFNGLLGLTQEQKDYAVEEAMFHRMSHGGGVYDLRYQILRNFNWSLEEKRKLVYDFYEDEYDFMLHLDAFERKVIRHSANFGKNNISLMELDKIYDYNLTDLENKYQDSVVAVEVFDEINFCRMLHQIRPITLRENNKVYKKHS